MVKYSVPKDSALLIAIDSESFEVKNLKEAHTFSHRIFEIPENGEFDGKPVSKGDYILMMWDYRLDKEFHTIIKQDTDLHHFYNEIRYAEESELQQYQSYCIECESTK